MATQRPPGRRAATPVDTLPLELRRLWGLATTARRGRPATLDVRRVVRTAVTLADRHGLDGVSLPRVASELGYTAMSLYRYVGSKDQLLTLMRDEAVGDPPVIDTSPAAWREGLRRWARAERRLYRRRAWLARLPIAPPAGPNGIGWMECALHVLRGTGLGWAEKVGVLVLLSGMVRHTTLLAQDLEHGWAAARLGQAQAERRYSRSLKALIDPDRFPETAALLASDILEAPPARADAIDDPDFAFGLERILDGVAIAVAGADRARRSRPARRRRSNLLQ